MINVNCPTVKSSKQNLRIRNEEASGIKKRFKNTKLGLRDLGINFCALRYTYEVCSLKDLEEV
jgi:hypothetical protein